MESTEAKDLSHQPPLAMIKMMTIRVVVTVAAIVLRFDFRGKYDLLHIC
jgi:hypothetical protein